jgi:cysteine-rich repeat protein
MRVRWTASWVSWALGASGALCLASVASATGNPDAALRAADSAMSRERFCDAAFLYRRLDELEPDATAALRAAEALSQGGDRAGALAIVTAFPARFPGHPQSATAAKRVELLQAAIAKVGPGDPCPIPPPQCGNGLVESGESCDDGNRADGDACPATCSAGTSVTPPPPPMTTAMTTSPPPTPPPPTSPPPPTLPQPTPTPPTATPASATTTSTAPAGSLDADDETKAVSKPSSDENEDADADAEASRRVLAEPAPAPEVEPTTAEAPIVGIAVATAGGLITATSLSAVVIGVIPAISYLAGARDQAAAANRYRQADTVTEQRQAAGDAADAYADQANRAFLWNGQGRWLAIGGGVGLGLGMGLLIGGLASLGDSGDDDSGKDGT